MNEEELIETWNKQRGQIISAQMQPVLVLIATFVLSALGYFDKATDEAKYFALVVVAVTGILTTLNQYAAIREGEAVCDDLAKIALATKIAKSRSFVSATAALIVVLDIAVFVVAYLAIFGM
jgi:predicted nucleic acid-binding Zn ribbon protein